ncbi:hypothetical protein NDU88_006132 [Pleurodeles waltl]|uniref:Uncharacterized protein n=1 Tax=Pleurodeles waltl TaxID=8319 RepID=A0AAV7RP15_PLEWA|nr:hypothetical protein NDU88_006132 [Pleurodeles waltl]
MLPFPRSHLLVGPTRACRRGHDPCGGHQKAVKSPQQSVLQAHGVRGIRGFRGTGLRVQHDKPQILNLFNFKFTMYQEPVVFIVNSNAIPLFEPQACL